MIDVVGGRRFGLRLHAKNSTRPERKRQTSQRAPTPGDTSCSAGYCRGHEQLLGAFGCKVEPLPQVEGASQSVLALHAGQQVPGTALSNVPSPPRHFRPSPQSSRNSSEKIVTVLSTVHDSPSFLPSFFPPPHPTTTKTRATIDLAGIISLVPCSRACAAGNDNCASSQCTRQPRRRRRRRSPCSPGVRRHATPCRTRRRRGGSFR